MSDIAMELKYPASKISIDDMCEIIKFFGIEKTEYTDCTILYEVTFEQLRAIYSLGKDHAGHNAEPKPAQIPAELAAWANSWQECEDDMPVYMLGCNDMKFFVREQLEKMKGGA
ncbi:MAG: hypothetical protein ACYC36_02650 [Bellilinea sp.]